MSNNYEGYEGYTQQQGRTFEPFDPQQYERQHNNPLEYQQPYAPVDHPYTGSQQQYMPPMGQGAGFNPYSMGTGNFSAGFCYLGLWLTGLLFLLFEHKNRLIRFHAMQSLLFFGGVNVLYIVLIPIMSQQIPFIYGFAILAFVIMNIVALVAWFVGVINGFKGKYIKLPFVGDFAERFVNSDINLK